MSKEINGFMVFNVTEKFGLEQLSYEMPTYEQAVDFSSKRNEKQTVILGTLKDAVSPVRLQCLEIASKLKTVDGEAMALKELIGKAEALYEFINKK